MPRVFHERGEMNNNNKKQEKENHARESSERNLITKRQYINA